MNQIIVLNADEEMLISHTGLDCVLDLCANDDTYLGVHKSCRGPMMLRDRGGYYVIVCEQCDFRVPITIIPRTLEDIRRHLLAGI